LREGIKGRGINNFLELFIFPPSPSPLPSRERRYFPIFSQLPLSRGRGSCWVSGRELSIFHATWCLHVGMRVFYETIRVDKQIIVGTAGTCQKKI
jgi:hypothetical protein